MRKMIKNNLKYLLILVLASTGMFFMLNESATDEYAEYNIVHKLNYTFNLKNVTPRTLPEANVWVALPLAINSRQYVFSIDASDDSKKFRDEFNNQEMFFAYNGINKGEVKSVAINMTVGYRGRDNNSTDVVGEFLLGEDYIDIDSKDIKNIASGFKSDDVNVTADKILNWLKDHKIEVLDITKSQLSSLSVKTEKVYLGSELLSPFDEERDGAIAESAVAIDKQQYSKSAFLHMYIAFSRSLGIPARGLVGFDYSGKAILNTNDATLWAEYHDGVSWQLVNLDKFTKVSGVTKFIAFKVLKKMPSAAGWEPYSVLHKDAAFEVDLPSVKLSIN